MKKSVFTLIVALAAGGINVYADAVAEDAGKYKEEAGLGIGALIGGLIAGPPGAIIGAAGGAWFGDKQTKKDQEIVTLQDTVHKRNTELALMEDRLSRLQLEFGNKLQKVSVNNRLSSLEDLSEGVSLAVYFRTGSAGIDDGTRPRIAKLAGFLQQFPEIKLHLEGHADKRGADHFNKDLSQKRAEAVGTALTEAGIDKQRIHISPFGESRAQAPESDIEGVTFDRRVDVVLTLDTRI